MIKRNVARVWLIVATVFFGIAGLFSLPLVMMSPMMFDAPGSERNPAIVIFFWCLISFPVICGLSIFLSWIWYKRERFQAARLVSLAPLLSLIVGATALGFLVLSQ